MISPHASSSLNHENGVVSAAARGTVSINMNRLLIRMQMLSNIYKIGRRFSLSSIERDFSTTQEKNLQKVVTHNTTSNRL